MTKPKASIEATIKDLCKTQSGWKTIDLIDSTNLEVQRLPEEHLVLFAGKQISGRGRGQHSWSNDESWSNILCSVKHTAAGAPHPIITIKLGLKLHTLMKHFALPNCSIKAPNDIYISALKVAGLLVESYNIGSSKTGMVIGLGLNVLHTPKGVTTATHLAAHDIQAVEKLPGFLTELLQQWNSVLNTWDTPTLTPSECELLVPALNQRFLEKDPHFVTSVSPEGNIQTKDGLISWLEL